MTTVSPVDTERYALRVLLLNRKGATSFDELKTIDGHRYEKFLDAAKAVGFLDDDNYFRESLLEAANFQTPAALRSYFSCLLCYCEISNANTLWNVFSGVMADDFLHRGFTREQSIAFAYFDIADRMVDLGKHLQDFVEVPQDERPEIPELPVNYEAHAAKGALKHLMRDRKPQLTLFSQRSTDKRIVASLWMAQEGQARRICITQFTTSLWVDS
ncbi:unnamed protein product [Heligmosomoides polygyrus]|uniref:DUF4476 domain-containing protein n=1 Tax=Heligmosomoides polygyrus TaxID=6339 RepID=A0A183FMJ9_HELPZ|nr:unnamed protein product [Heligmosomoides polygyrus]